jgi:hypothetical protein
MDSSRPTASRKVSPARIRTGRPTRHGPPPGGVPPQPPKKKSHAGLIVTVVAIVLVLIIVGGAARWLSQARSTTGPYPVWWTRGKLASFLQ